jgi:hypothetical protein
VGGSLLLLEPGKSEDTQGSCREFSAYMGARKKWWLLPILLLLFVFGGVLIQAQGSAVARFI